MEKPFNQIEFGKLAEFRNGLNFSKNSHGKGCLLIGIPDFKNNFSPDYGNLKEINPDGIAKSDDYLAKDDIIFVRSNGNKELVGRSLYFNRNLGALFSGFCIRARITSTKLDAQFCAYYTKTRTFRDSISSSTGTNINNLNQGILGNVLIPLFSISTQQKIAKVLSTFDAKIELNNRINEELEGMAKLLYDYWFVQFEFPITAEQAAGMRKPQLEGKPYKTSGGKMVYNEELKREIPEGWEVDELSRLCGLNSRTWSKENYPKEITYVDLANTKQGRISRTVIYRKEDAPSRAQRVLLPGDTIVGTVRPENCSFSWIHKSHQGLTGSTGFAVLTPEKPFYREFNYIGITCPLNISRLSIIASGAAYPAVNPRVVAALRIPMPSDGLIKSFHKSTYSSFNVIENNQQQNQQLTQLRDWLLPMLMNGQVTVK